MVFQAEPQWSDGPPTARFGLTTWDESQDDAFQAAMLQGVSRTFALTIPQLPVGLHRVVANAYLLCRTVDTIEDEPALSFWQRQRFYRHFLRLLGDGQSAEKFSEDLGARLSPATIAAEHDLIHNVPRVLRITRSFPEPQRRIVENCVGIMAEGMEEFQRRGVIQTLQDLDRYCYYVAGVVGEMLTSLFCLYSPGVNKQHDQLMALAVSFGEALQMTNILKDAWEDYSRGACWLPREVFAQEGCDVGETMKSGSSDSFRQGIQCLIGVAHRHLRNALDYTLLIPADESGIRKFCLWAIGFALLTLRKIHDHLDYTGGDQVKISRLSVKATILVAELGVHHDHALNAVFSLLSRNLPLSRMSLGWSPRQRLI